LTNEERQELLSSQSEYVAARAELARASGDIARAERELGDARAMRMSAAEKETSAHAERDQAHDSGQTDNQKKNETSRAARIATLELRAADGKVAVEEGRVAYLRRLAVFAQLNVYAQKARYEETKARLARRKNIRPVGFRYSDFAEQKDRRWREAQHAYHLAEQEKDALAERERLWKAAVDEAAQARGNSPAATPVRKQVPAAENQDGTTR
jgi:hypothetical protein